MFTFCVDMMLFIKKNRFFLIFKGNINVTVQDSYYRRPYVVMGRPLYFAAVVSIFLLSLWPPVVMGRPLCCTHVVSSFFFFLSLSFFLLFPSLFSAVADWMSTILPHMMWP